MRDRLVVGGHQVKAWYGLPGWCTGGGDQRRKRDSALAERHNGREFVIDIGAKQAMEMRGIDITVAVTLGRSRVGADDEVGGQLGRTTTQIVDLRERLSLVRRVGRDVDQRLNVRVAGATSGNDRAALRVAHQDDRTPNSGQERPQVFTVGMNPAQRVGRRITRIPLSRELGDELAPAGCVGESAMD